MFFLKNALMCIEKVKLINHGCLPILMLCIMLAYLLFVALSNAVCLYNAFLLLNLQMLFVFMLCLVC